MSDVILRKYLDLFDRKAFGHLATIVPDGRPQVTPTWVEYDGRLGKPVYAKRSPDEVRVVYLALEELGERLKRRSRRQPFCPTQSPQAARSMRPTTRASLARTCSENRPSW